MLFLDPGLAPTSRAAPLGWLPRARTPLGRSAQPADPAAMAAELEDLEASASAASAARSWSRSWSAGIAALAAAALLVGATALARRRGALEAHGFGSDADLVSFSLAKVKNDTAKAPPSEHDLDLDSVVAAATLRVEALSHDRALAEGMEQMAAAVSADDKVQIVKALRTLRVAVNGLIGEVKSLETGLHMCGRIVCTGQRMAWKVCKAYSFWARPLASGQGPQLLGKAYKFWARTNPAPHILEWPQKQPQHKREDGRERVSSVSFAVGVTFFGGAVGTMSQGQQKSDLKWFMNFVPSRSMLSKPRVAFTMAMASSRDAECNDFKSSAFEAS
ncbi:unnamed protein product [Prorocentrum cordatum]|uniref:Uncharacterized protein n=1 Tax=Prorocentrum cordatum TaxID=2364126 RepID=A0ABN9VM19_9DINO|nr:unnamed protein product [Polarella glacialis]